MPNRHLCRSIALQTLYECDFWDCLDSAKKETRARIEKILKQNLAEFAPGLEDVSFVKELLEGVLKHIDKLNNVIVQAAPEWPLAQITPVDRNVLRLGLFELLHSDRQEVPPKVAINEAIELAKTFGGSASGRFVNGVLGTVYREMGEPGKDD